MTGKSPRRPDAAQAGSRPHGPSPIRRADWLVLCLTCEHSFPLRAAPVRDINPPVVFARPLDPCATPDARVWEMRRHTDAARLAAGREASMLMLMPTMRRELQHHEAEMGDLHGAPAYKKTLSAENTALAVYPCAPANGIFATAKQCTHTVYWPQVLAHHMTQQLHAASIKIFGKHAARRVTAAAKAFLSSTVTPDHKAFNRMRPVLCCRTSSGYVPTVGL